VAFVCVCECYKQITVKSNKLHPSGPSKSFMHPSVPETVWVRASEVLTKVKSQTVTHHTYAFSEKHSHRTKQKLQQDIQMYLNIILRCIRATPVAAENE